MYAIVDTGGRQIRAERGARILLDHRPVARGEEIVLDRVLFVGGEGAAKVGTPHVPGAQVRCRVLAEEKGPKVLVFRYKSKKGVRRKTGHRQRYLAAVVEEIVT